MKHGLVLPVVLDRSQAANSAASNWLDDLAKNLGFANHEVNEIERLVREYRVFLIGAWHEYFDA